MKQFSWSILRTELFKFIYFSWKIVVKEYGQLPTQAGMRRTEALASIEISCFFVCFFFAYVFKDLAASSHNNNNEKVNDVLKRNLRFEFHENAILQS